MKICITSLFLLAAFASAAAQAASGVAVNVNGGKASALRQGAEAAGVDLEFASETDFGRLPDVLVWQADEKGARLSDDDRAKLEAHLAGGAGLLITLSRNPGLDAFSLTPVSPTTAWQTLMPVCHSGAYAPATGSGEFDSAFFPGGVSVNVPFRFRMRPMDAVESGEARREASDRDIPHTSLKLAAGEPFVTRSLLNREWRSRLYARGGARESLLITGLYGAGRVAVFASTAECGSDSFWKEVFAFLSRKPQPKASGNPRISDISFTASGRKSEIYIHATNYSKDAVRLPIVARVSSWNGEYICDVSRTFVFPGGKKSMATIVIPDGEKLRPQSLDFRRCLNVRAGVLAPDGSAVLKEDVLVLDASLPVSIKMLAPGTGRYCFSPGESCRFTVAATNSLSKSVTLNFDIAVSPFNADGTTLGERLDDTIPAGGGLTREFEVTMPKLNGGEKFGAGRIELMYKGKTVAYLPYMVAAANGKPPMPSASAGDETLAIVHEGCMGLANWAPDGTGSRAASEASTSEENVFAYSRRLNQTREDETPDPSRLFLAETGFTGKCNPWGHALNGDRFFESAQGEFINRATSSGKWKDAKSVEYVFGECWDVGPAMDVMFSWQEIVEFDRHLRKSGRRGLLGRTFHELKDEIEQTQMHQFLKWQFETYLANFRQLRDQMESRGKKMSIGGHGVPLVPPEHVQEFAEKLGGISVDPRLEFIDEDMSLSVARAMALKALNPHWQLKPGLVWGRDSYVYSRHHAEALGTTETSRRQAAAKAWRSVIANDGRCVPLYTCGFADGGDSSLQDENDLQQKSYSDQRIARIRPDGPMGMGLCLGAGVLTDENSFVFSGGGSEGSSLADKLLGRSFRMAGELDRRGIGVSFAANAKALMNTQPSLREPLLVPLPDTFDADERAFIATWAKSRGKIVFVTDGKAIAPEFAELFGGSEMQPGSEAVSLSKYGVMIDQELEKITQKDFDLAARLVRENFDLGVVLPEGTLGYGFTADRRRFVAVADICEQGREVTVKLRAGFGKTATAMEFNEHRRLDVVRDGAYWSVTFPLKRADGNLIMIEER